MPYAVTLCLDPVAAVAVERLWQAVADRFGANQVMDLGYRPHVSLAILPDEVPTEPMEAAVAHLAATCGRLPITLAGIAVFPGEEPVLWAAPAQSEALLRCHSALAATLVPLSVHPHYRPGDWVPHVTLAKERSVPAGALLDAALTAWDGPIHAWLDRVDLVRFRPVTILRSAPLRPDVRT